MKNIRTSVVPLAIFLLIFSFHKVSSQQRTGIKWMDVDYVGDNHTGHQMDIYLPNKIKGTFPVILIIYGSAWFNNNGKLEAFKILGQPLLDSGFAVVAVNHRSSRDAKYPAQIHDIKAAIRYIRVNAKKYSINPSFIGITGYSSGGHLAALAGTSGGVGKFKLNEAEVELEGEIGPHPSISSRVDAVVDWYGPTNFLMMDSCGSKMQHNAATSPESSLIGGAIQENKDKVALANPVTYIDKNDPPFLILHGDADDLVPYCQSLKLHEELQKNEVRNEFILVPGAGHGPGLHEEKYFGEMVRFFISEYKKTKK